MQIVNKHSLKSIILANLNVVAYCIILYWIVYKSMIDSICTPTYHLDGAFQTASGLFRLDSGQFPGRDFFPYLGIGPIFILFPIFKLAGGTLASSVFAAKFMTFIFSWLAFSVVFQLLVRPKNFLLSGIYGGFLFLLSFYIYNQNSFFKLFTFGFNPGNSLRPIRSGVPYIVAILSLLIIKSNKNTLLWEGIVIGLCLLWSNDFAIPTVFTFLVLYISLILVSNKSQKIKSILVLGIFSCLVGVVALFLATMGHPFELLKYNFIDVATDQWWFYGPYGENYRVFHPAQIFKIISEENFLPLCILAIILVLSILSKKLEYWILFAIGFNLFLGGSLASIGGHIGRYFICFYYWALIIILVAPIMVIKKIFQYVDGKYLIESYSVFQILIISSITIIFYFVGKNNFLSYKNNMEYARENLIYVSELGSFVETEWKEYIDYIRLHKKAFVTEEYWGIWSSLARKFSSMPVDSIIHALGKERDKARSNILKSEYIITTRYKVSPYQTWSISQNYWFYEEVLKNYIPDFISPTTVVWKKMPEKRFFTEVSCSVSSNKSGFMLGDDVSGFYEVDVDYVSSSKWRYLAMVQNNISYTLGANGYVSIPPKGNKWTFPVYVPEGQNAYFNIKTVGNLGEKFKLISCTARKIPYLSDEILHKEN